ncbi:hypothetical protein [Mucilaginibacter lappiensis]|uniref:Uncharacterized protein n=1 Tax=Mucilaginibacter lappiensis TaxID=354630 RepID=A0A1N6TBC0_9SPHI|nr:hypothetical protein [Mucilaginibacter lappiensis]MBB6108133.1 hypothetical protein [Mucilaginibacter lappiensis]MBB6130277.1 hypothetical protein [Mucilaginibacter lappiensis]SIQ50685.1 hypothetical protein SAMN05421821_102631 [Mucilaginibacter lappiensis]
MKLKPIITEVIILAVIYIVARLSVPLFIGNTSMDINFNDTYWVINQSAIVILIFTVPVFLMLTTVTYLIKEGFYRYKRKVQNLILIVANFLFITVIYLLSLLFNMIQKAGGTLYPPLSALPKTVSPAHHDSNVVYTAMQITPALIIIFMLILVITAILTGKNWNLNKNEQIPA